MFLWKSPDDYPERLLGSYDAESSPDRYSFKQGREVSSSETMPTVRFQCPSKELAGIDDLASNVMVPIVSERLQQVLREKCPGDIQLLDVRLIASDGLL